MRPFDKRTANAKVPTPRLHLWSKSKNGKSKNRKSTDKGLDCCRVPCYCASAIAKKLGLLTKKLEFYLSLWQETKVKLDGNSRIDRDGGFCPIKLPNFCGHFCPNQH